MAVQLNFISCTLVSLPPMIAALSPIFAVLAYTQVSDTNTSLYKVIWWISCSAPLNPCHYKIHGPFMAPYRYWHQILYFICLQVELSCCTTYCSAELSITAGSAPITNATIQCPFAKKKKEVLQQLLSKKSFYSPTGTIISVHRADEK